ncbi:MAG: hypothetical protein Q7S51_06605 [Gallionellaceae bacterium]|nr:hypothetical protein [Gallionellaceae bacterium]
MLALVFMSNPRPIHNEAGYKRMTALMNALLDAAGDDEDHPLSGLLNLLGDMISKYEQEHYAIEPAEPRDALRFLIEARGLKQEDMSDIIPQSNLSAILAGKRKISATLAGKLVSFLVLARLYSCQFKRPECVS